LLTQLPEFTGILVTGPAIKHIEAACSIARQLQPAIVVIEDVDLIAEDRSMTDGNQPLLLQMLNELDGLGEDSDIAFVLTTNRVETLERALVDRPGRVDLALEIPLPDAQARRQLFQLYGEKLGLPIRDLDAGADRSQGVTASFAKEAVRRAVLISMERESLTVESVDLTQSLDELLDARSELTQRLLGLNAEAAGVTQAPSRSPADLDDPC